MTAKRASTLRPAARLGLLVAMALLASSTAAPAAAAPAAAALPAGIHWIGTRPTAAGGTELFDRRTESLFVSRGVNLLKDEPQATGPYPVLDMLVAPGEYDDAWTRAHFKQLAKLGYNTARVWLDHCPGNCLTNPDGSARPAWLDNVAALLVAARDHGLTILLTSNELPEAGYADQLPSGGVFDGGFNSTILSSSGVNLTLSYWRTVIVGLQARGAPLEVVLAYELLNETFLELDRNPLALTSGLVTAANGVTYDMSLQASRDAMVDQGLVYWANQAAAVIRAIDPGALVTAGFFAPSPGSRLVRSAYFAQHADVDLVDVHHYPGMGSHLGDDLVAMGLDGYRSKPLVLGEFGAFRLGWPDAKAGADGLVALQAQSCALGLDGWLTWMMGALQPELFGVEEDKDRILKALSPVKRPDPCSTSGVVTNHAAGAAVDVSAQVPGMEGTLAVDGLAVTSWSAGGSAPASITLDLGGPVTITELRLLTSQFPAGATTHVVDARTATGAWATIHVFSGFTVGDEWLRWYPGKPLKGIQYLRVTTTSSPSWVGWREIAAY